VENVNDKKSDNYVPEINLKIPDHIISYSERITKIVNEHTRSFENLNETFHKIEEMVASSLSSKMKAIINVQNQAINTLNSFSQNVSENLNLINMNQKISEIMSAVNWKGILDKANRAKEINAEADPEILTKLADLGWSAPTCIYIPLHLYSLKHEENLNKHMIQTLNTISDSLDDDFKIIVFQMIDVLNDDWKKYKLCTANLFMILEHLSVMKVHPELKTKRLLNKPMIEELMADNGEGDIYSAAKGECKKAIKAYYDHQNFEEITELKFGRHSFLHGRYSPEKLSFLDFLKLVNCIGFYFEVTEELEIV
jgi:hypothetical protein